MADSLPQARLAAAKSGVGDTFPSVRAARKSSWEQQLFLLLGTGQMDSALVPHLTLKTLPGLVSGYQAAGQGSGCLFPLYLAASWWTKCPSPIQTNTFQTAFLLFRAFLKQNSKLGVSWQTVVVQTSSKSCLARIFKWVPSAIPRNKNLGLPRPYPPF